ncbi:MAG: Uma2 family endonuclease, partial [Planctomycetes bacterium]|nr:Uma2 family endonuclease [Planctomycetota bacterium]
YEDLGVKEYFIFDPLEEWLRPPLRGYRRQGDSLEQFVPLREEPGLQVFFSQVLGLELHGSLRFLRWVDPRTGRSLFTVREAYAQADVEKARAEAAEAEAARLRSEIERLRGTRGAP